MSEPQPRHMLRSVDHPGFIGLVRRQWPWVSVVTIVILGLVLIAFGQWQFGAVFIGFAMILAGFLRGFLSKPGILVIRPKRWIDLCLYFGLGIAILVLLIVRGTPE